MNNRVLQTLRGLRDRLQNKTDSLTRADFDILNKANGLIADLERVELNPRITNNDNCLTIPHYWDCECKDNYIHPKVETLCLKCGVNRDDQPDSRLNEVRANGFPIPDKAISEKKGTNKDRTVSLMVVLGDISVESKPDDITVTVYDFTRADADPEYEADVFPAVTLTKLDQENQINAHREGK